MNEDIKELKHRWINILRMKATYEHEVRKRGEIVPSPSIDDICNEMEAFFTGLSISTPPRDNQKDNG